MIAGAGRDEDVDVGKGRFSEGDGMGCDGISSIAKPVSRLYNLRSAAQGCRSSAREVMSKEPLC